MKFAIRIEEVHAETFLIEAGSLEEAIAKAERYNENIGFDLPEVTEFNIAGSPDAKGNGEATKLQLDFCRKLDFKEDELNDID